MAQARLVAQYLAAHDVRLPDGAPLSVAGVPVARGHARLSTGSHELHYLLEDPFAGDELSDAFLYAVAAKLSFAAGAAVRAAARAVLRPGVRDPVGRAADQGGVPRVRSRPGARRGPGTAPLLFTGEMIYPWMIDADPVLRPLREAADLLAERDDWPPLYDPSRLAANEVPVAAAVYYDDMYVDRELSMRTASAIRGLRTWVTSEYEHDGLRVSAGAVLDRLIGMCRGNI